jgi:hypothetical protein
LASVIGFIAGYVIAAGTCYIPPLSGSGAPQNHYCVMVSRSATVSAVAWLGHPGIRLFFALSAGPFQQYRLAGSARVLFVIRNVNEFVAALSERSLKIQHTRGGRWIRRAAQTAAVLDTLRSRWTLTASLKALHLSALSVPPAEAADGNAQPHPTLRADRTARGGCSTCAPGPSKIPP